MNKLICLLIFCIIFISCGKSSPPPGDNTPSCLANGAWFLISSSSTNSLIPRYKGIASDSVRFVWTWAKNGNFVIDSIYSYIGGNIARYSTKFSYGAYTTLYGQQDSLKCYPAWKPSLSNDIFIKRIDDYCSLLVLSINSADGSYAEIDSLKK